jgi:transposase
MQTDERAGLWAFVDWACESHTVCVVDVGGVPLHEGEVDNTPAGLAALVLELTRLCQGDLARMRIAIEVPHGPVVDALLEAGFAVFTLNPKQIDRFRDRYSPAGAKDDRRDAFVGANALRTDPDAFRHIDPDHPAVVELREWGRIDRNLGQDSVAQANRLREQVLRVGPHWLKLCGAADKPWFWDLLELAPVPQHAGGLTLADVQAVLHRHRIRRWSAAQVLAVWQSACLGTPQGVLTAVAAHIRVLLDLLRLLHAQRRTATAELNRCLKACHTVFATEPGRRSDVEIALSQPGVGIRVAACLFGEASRALRERNLKALRAQSGTGPVTKQSGKTKLVIMRRSCQNRLRDACYHWARAAVIYDARCKAHYGDLKRRGHSHARALRGVVDRLMDRFFVMLQHGTLYDPNYRRVPTGSEKA